MLILIRASSQNLNEDRRRVDRALLCADAEPGYEVGEGVGASLFSSGEGADGLMYLRVVSGLLWRGSPCLVQGGERLLMVAV